MSSYATLAEFREAGFDTPGWPAEEYPGSYLQALLDRTAATIDQLTGNLFSLSTRTIYLDGQNERHLPLRPTLHTISGATMVIGGTSYSAAQTEATVELIELVPGDKRTQRLRILSSGDAVISRWPLPRRPGDLNIEFTSDSWGWIDDSVTPPVAPSPIVQANIDMAARLLIRGYNETEAGSTSATGGLKREKQEIWEREWFEMEGSASVAKGLEAGDDIAMMLEPFTFQKAKFSSVVIPRG